MEGEQVEFALLPKYLGGPAVLLCGGFDVAQNGADVNRLAVVATMIFAKLFHAENFTQRRENAKKFYLLTDVPFPACHQIGANFPTQSWRVCGFFPSDKLQSPRSRE